MNKQVHTPPEQVPEQAPETGATRARQDKRKSATQVLDGQLSQNEVQAANDPVKAQETGAITSGAGQTKQVRVRGKDKVPRKKRYGGSITANIPPDEKQIIVRYNVELWSLGKLKNPNDEKEVRERLTAYFSISDKYQQVPTVAGMALALGIDRRTLWTWMEEKSGTIKNRDVLDTLKGVYNMISSQYEGMLTQGKIVPVSGFFLLQNNFGYKNQTDHVVVAQPAEEPDTGEIASRAGLLEDSDD